ncbi:MAG: branched-chain amino acid ABC transporter permease [Proteobacteria bacterium]|nr:branched-chain amino acid ABC transporter permease [Pseudomonadota bacterium]NIS70390.1 branched-chain amino acid ABC transporter permease [Pseudomonadota bacterium]
MPDLMANLLFLLVDGLVWGLIIALIALGLTLIFGIMGIINMAHGDLYMVGAVLAVVLGSWVNFWLALVLAPIILGIAALPVERWVLRPFEGKPLVTMVGTIGVSFIIQQVVLMTFGGTPKIVAYPIFGVVNLIGGPYPAYRIFAAFAGLILIGALWLLIYKTNFGIYVRATMEVPQMADAIGINTSLIRVITFGLGAGLAAAGGVLAAPIRQVFFLMGADVILISFIVVIVGGLGSLKGALVAALGISAVEGMLSAALDPVQARAAIMMLMALVLVFRPRGLFG